MLWVQAPVQDMPRQDSEFDLLYRIRFSKVFTPPESTKVLLFGEAGKLSRSQFKIRIDLSQGYSGSIGSSQIVVIIYDCVVGTEEFESTLTLI